MTAVKKYSQLSCEQVYNLWISEPEVIQLIDLRSTEVYWNAHIPGARHLDLLSLKTELKKIGDNRLAVIVANKEQESEILNHISEFDNFVFLKECTRWAELKFPVASREYLGHFIDDYNKGASVNNDIIFQQLFEPESSTYTYFIADKKTKEAAIIDPVLETVDRDMNLIEELGLKVLYILDTHIHADHITGAGELRKKLGAKTAVSKNANVNCVDVQLEEGQEILLGNKKIKVIATPGHTDTCLSYYFEGMVFTGDALLIRGCGRTDFQQGNSETLFKSVREKLYKLPDDTILYPGHDYRGITSSTIGLEKKHNLRLKESINLEGFKKIMSELKLANPKKIHDAVPANLSCGKPQDNRLLHPQIADGIPEISVDDLNSHLRVAQEGKIQLIDVRRPDEYNNELGHIDGAELITLGPDLMEFLENGDREKEIVFICRSGARSGTATAESIRMGYKYTVNMVGGMLRWNEKKFPTTRNN